MRRVLMLDWTLPKMRGLVHRYGPAPLKRYLWDREYRGGRWDCLDRQPGSVEHLEVERYARGGAILDLGCGPGSTGHELTPGSYSSYTGVDISAVAIETEQRRLRQVPAPHHYEQGDLVSYVPAHPYEVILLGDSIYYVALAQIPALVRRYAGSLTSTGHLIVRVCDPTGRYQPLLRSVAETLTVVEHDRVVNAEGVPVHVLVGHLRSP